MSSILEQLELKPVPQKKKDVKIVLPQEGQVKIKAQIIDNRDEKYDRGTFIKRLKRVGFITSPLKKATPAPLKIAFKMTRKLKIRKTAEGPPRIKKLKGKFRIGKTIQKGTITGLAQMKVTGKVSVKKSRKLPQVEEDQISIGVEDIQDRLPTGKAAIKIKANAYYMNNREIFINFINSLFEPYRDANLDDSKNISCESKGGEFALLTHQEIVRDYINLYTPYRGLLLYHGLGAGKTCASIAIAEGLKNNNEVIIMTPASLRSNYISELKTCGDPLYRLNQYWQFIKTNDNPSLTTGLSSVLSLTKNYIEKQGGAWLVDARRESNFGDLSIEEKTSLNDQINEMIRAKYRFINYNGLRDSHLSGFSDNGRINPFSNKVIIIDEAHNFVSRIVNKITKPDSLSMKLYEFLLSAENSRLVFLTGTPIINYPNEIGVLFNMLRGYIKTFIFYVNVQTSERINQSTIEAALSTFKIQDYVQYNPSAKTIVITRNPFQYASQYKTKTYMGVRKNKGKNTCQTGRDCETGFVCNKEEKACVPMDDQAFVKIITDILRKKQIITRKVEQKSYKALPDTLDGFNTQFIDFKSGDIKNENLLQRRILGLTSYFRSAREELMPTLDVDKDIIIEEIQMSNYQFSIYEAARSKERSQEKRNAKKKKMKAAQGNGLYDDSASTYRIFSRAFCNFVFPKEIGRPMPKEDQDIGEALNGQAADDDLLDVVSLDEKLANVDGKYELDDAAALKKKEAAMVDKTYDARIQQSIKDLKTNGETFLSPRGLEIYSPKFLHMYNNIINAENKGLHLVYSQFRTLEGIGIFSLVLEQNGFFNFKLQKTGGGWDLAFPIEDLGKPSYALYTGTEEVEEKEILRNIFNGDWNNIPKNIEEKLRNYGSDNKMGDVIKVFMITSSGAEGITLKNTRFVHIVEPYWHPVRVEQVIGRARRICSHHGLPEELRNVKVFMYLMTFSKEQLVPATTGGMASKELLKKDVSKVDKKTPFTSDQALFEISTIKEEINKQILRSMKSSAIDCALHAREGDKDKVVCVSFGAISPKNYTTTPALTIEKDYDKQRQQNLKRITWKAKMVTLGAKRYAFKSSYPKVKKGKKSKIGEIYDLDSYLRARKHGGNPVLKGYLRPDPKTGAITFEAI